MNKEDDDDDDDDDVGDDERYRTVDFINLSTTWSESKR
jgi:hypothetical protein